MPTKSGVPTLSDIIGQYGDIAQNLEQQKAAKQKQANVLEQLATESKLKQQSDEARRASEESQLMRMFGAKNIGEAIQKATEQGQSIKTGDISVGADPMARLATQMPGKMGEEARKVGEMADKHFKPFKSQLEAGENTLNYLNQGNPYADKAALVNEATMLLGGSGSRGVASIVATLSGDPTMAGNAVKAMNWLNNTANVQMQPAQRNALREMVLQRMPAVQQQYQSAKKQFAGLAQSYAPLHASQGNLDPLVSNFTSPMDESMNRLNQMNTEYMKQKAQAGNPNVANPAQFNPQPTTLDKLKKFLAPGRQSTQPTPQTGMTSPVQSTPDYNSMSDEELTKAYKAKMGGIQ